MTRINLVDPSTLHSKHLLAEYRELPRVFKLVEAAEKRGLTPIGLPTTYRLGIGHVKFFYNKLSWLQCRFSLLVRECEHRGFQIQHKHTPAIKASPHWFNMWAPCPEDIALNAARIKDRMPK